MQNIHHGFNRELQRETACVQVAICPSAGENSRIFEGWSSRSGHAAVMFLQMLSGKEITFGHFRLDATNECLWHGERSIPLRPKAFAVLKLLLDHPRQLVTKQQVLDAVWPGTFVSDAVLKESIHQLREALGDKAEAPAYIETAHRRGYRFIASVTEQPAPNTNPNPSPKTKSAESSMHAADARQLCFQAAATGPSCTVEVLGRDAELGKLREWLQKAVSGERQIVFVTGEAGIGKTTLVDAFLAPAAASVNLRVAHGQCLEHFGAGEPYLPVLDAFSRLGKGPAAEPLIACLRRHAPTWLAQLPSLISGNECEELRALTMSTTRERMLREFVEALEAFTAEVPLVLVLEDLHWSDYSTLDLISYLARRCDRACLFVMGTYRPVEVIVSEHPLKAVKRELGAHNLCREIPLEYLSEEATAGYLKARFLQHHLPRKLVRMIHQHTEGNPLFMVNVVEYLVDHKLIAEEEGTWKLLVDVTKVRLGVPDTLKQLIQKQIERLSLDERTVLEGASVVGMECSVVAIAAGLDKSTEWVEKHCEELARRHQFLSPALLVELPDGTLTPRHRFNHVLYLEVAYSLVPPMRRSQIHHRIAERGVSIYGDHVSEIAAELAMHFEQSRDWPRAAQYLLQAAENATHRSAHHESAALARRGLEVLKSLPDTPERRQEEIALRFILDGSLMALQAYAAAEVEMLSHDLQKAKRQRM
jgi:predicted ATPase/DNA-binding winged helix-turn-helix (wHTH) protein